MHDEGLHGRAVEALLSYLVCLTFFIFMFWRGAARNSHVFTTAGLCPAFAIHYCLCLHEQGQAHKVALKLAKRPMAPNGLLCGKALVQTSMASRYSFAADNHNLQQNDKQHHECLPKNPSICKHFNFFMFLYMLNLPLKDCSSFNHAKWNRRLSLSHMWVWCNLSWNL